MKQGSVRKAAGARLLAAVTRLGEAAVLLDVRGAFDPVSASENGVVPSQLLWVRPCSGASPASTRRRFAALDQVLMAADLLLQSGGFGLVVLDLASLDPRDIVKIPLTAWFRLRRAVDETRTLLLVLEREPHAGSSAAVVLDLAQARLNSLRRALPQARRSTWTVIAGLNLLHTTRRLYAARPASL